MINNFDIEKKTLRKVYSEKRNSLSYNFRQNASDIIANCLFSLEEYQPSDIILIYSSIKSEVSTEKIIKKSLSDKKKTALPKIRRNKIMTFHQIEIGEILKESSFGILEPSDKNEICSFSKNSLCIVPALAFDINGYRLGYGGGYYDRFLNNFEGRKIGLCYDSLLVSSLPHDIHDINVDIIITERRLLKINA